MVQRRFDVVTFDCYGTLIDWENGIADAFSRAAKRDGIQIEMPRLLASFAMVEPRVQQEGYRSYRDVLAETATRVARMHGWPLAYERAVFLAESLPSWPVFADTNYALERLTKGGYRLGILSNIDDDLLKATRRHFTVDFDYVVTAQQVRSYKPAPAHFIAARERIGTARWLHAAQSNMHDILPANALSIDNVWVNRKSEKPLPGGVPTRELRNLAELADWLG